MANSIIVYISNGSTNTFPINFTMGFISRDDVTCTVNGSSRTITWINDGSATVDGAALVNGDRVVFKRTVDKTQLIHDYENDADIEESNLDESNKQAMMAVHEVIDGRLESISQDLNMQGYKIIDVADGVDDNDAANMSQINAVIGDATDQAEASADSAELSEDWANKTDGTVASSEYSAKAYALGGTGVTGAFGAAKEWATKTSGNVDGTLFSAKEYAVGTQASTGGSAKNWAQQTGSDVTGASSNSRSSKSWAQDDLHGATLGGSAKDWAQSASLPDGTNKSSKSYAQDSANSAVNSATHESGAQTAQTSAEVARDAAIAAVGAVKVTTSDATPEVLNSQISAGTGLTKTVLNPGSNESLELKIANQAITNALLNAMSTLTVKSNVTGGSASPSDNTLTAILDAVIGSSRGSIIQRGSSAWQVLTTGAVGQFLKSLGSGADNAWSYPNLELIQSQIASNSASIDFSFTGTNYKTVILFYSDYRPATNGTDFNVRYSTGGSFVTATSNYRNTLLVMDSQGNGGNASGMSDGACRLSWTGDQSSGGNASGLLILPGPGNSSYYKNHMFLQANFGVSSVNRFTYGMGGTLFTGAIDGIRLFSSSGNLADGNFHLLGIR